MFGRLMLDGTLDNKFSLSLFLFVCFLLLSSSTAYLGHWHPQLPKVTFQCQGSFLCFYPENISCYSVKTLPSFRRLHPVNARGANQGLVRIVKYGPAPSTCPLNKIVTTVITTSFDGLFLFVLACKKGKSLFYFFEMTMKRKYFVRACNSAYASCADDKIRTSTLFMAISSECPSRVSHGHSIDVFYLSLTWIGFLLDVTPWIWGNLKSLSGYWQVI